MKYLIASIILVSAALAQAQYTTPLPTTLLPMYRERDVFTSGHYHRFRFGSIQWTLTPQSPIYGEPSLVPPPNDIHWITEFPVGWVFACTPGSSYPGLVQLHHWHLPPFSQMSLPPRYSQGNNIYEDDAYTVAQSSSVTNRDVLFASPWYEDASFSSTWDTSMIPCVPLNNFTMNTSYDSIAPHWIAYWQAGSPSYGGWTMSPLQPMISLALDYAPNVNLLLNPHMVTGLPAEVTGIYNANNNVTDALSSAWSVPEQWEGLWAGQLDSTPN